MSAVSQKELHPSEQQGLAAKRIAAEQLMEEIGSQHPYEIGKPYFIRTATYHYTGRLVAVFDWELVFEDAAWIAESERFEQSIMKGEFTECDVYPKGSKLIISRLGLIDCTQMVGPLPAKSTKRR